MDWSNWFKIPEEENIGATGLPIHTEIKLALAIIALTTWLLIIYNRRFNKDPHAHPTGSALPALLLTEEQQKKLSKLVLPVQSFVEVDEVAVEDDDPTNECNDSSDSTKRNSGQLQNQVISRMRQYSKPFIKFKRKMKFEPKLEHFTDKTPLLVFVNRKSGGQQGELLLYRLRALLHKKQVYDIDKNNGPEIGLSFFRNVPLYRILVAGGDGTIAWVLSAQEKLNLDYVAPISIIPTGTGNDLARTLGWGGGFDTVSSRNSLLQHLIEVGSASVTLLDRWNVDMKPAASKSGGKRKKKTDAPTKHYTMNNYIGVGVDAQIALNFHRKREKSPHLFTSQLVNKYVWYVSSGGKELLSRRFTDLSSFVTITCDGKELPLPAGIEGVIVLNIDSYGGGVDLWSSSDDDKPVESSPGSPVPFGDPKCQTFSLPSCQDKLLEVLGVSSLQLGVAQIGLSRPTRLCQCKSLVITTSTRLPVQVDGEPCELESSSISISHSNQAFMLTKSSRNSITQQVLDWAELNNVINSRQRIVLMKEISRRSYHANHEF